MFELILHILVRGFTTIVRLVTVSGTEMQI